MKSSHSEIFIKRVCLYGPDLTRLAYEIGHCNSPVVLKQTCRPNCATTFILFFSSSKHLLEYGNFSDPNRGCLFSDSMQPVMNLKSARVNFQIYSH